MSQEEVLMKEGDELARLAVENGLAAKQLRALYTLSVSSSLPYLQSVVKGQVGRRITGFRSAFGNRMLDLIEKYWNDKKSLSRVLEYADMLYAYYKEMARMPVTDEDIIPIIRPIVDEYGFQGVRIFPEREGIKIHVKLRNPPREREPLSQKIFSDLRTRVPKLRISRFRVWID